MGLVTQHNASFQKAETGNPRVSLLARLTSEFSEKDTNSINKMESDREGHGHQSLTSHTGAMGTHTHMNMDTHYRHLTTKHKTI